MPTRGQRARIVFAVACVALIASPAAAQTDRHWEAFGGYALVRDSHEDLNMPAGWVAGGARALNGWFSIVADAGGSYKTLPLIGGDVTVASHSVLAGGRIAARIGNVIEFGELLGGVVHTSGSAFGQSSSATYGAVQGGIGLDIPLRSRLAGRVEFDATHLSIGRRFRVTAAIVYAR